MPAVSRWNWSAASSPTESSSFVDESCAPGIRICLVNHDPKVDQPIILVATVDSAEPADGFKVSPVDRVPVKTYGAYIDVFVNFDVYPGAELHCQICRAYIQQFITV